jgi:hypothetical protein
MDNFLSIRIRMHTAPTLRPASLAATHPSTIQRSAAKRAAKLAIRKMQLPTIRPLESVRRRAALVGAHLAPCAAGQPGSDPGAWTVLVDTEPMRIVDFRLPAGKIHRVDPKFAS